MTKHTQETKTQSLCVNCTHCHLAAVLTALAKMCSALPFILSFFATLAKLHVESKKVKMELKQGRHYSFCTVLLSKAKASYQLQTTFNVQKRENLLAFIH